MLIQKRFMVVDDDPINNMICEGIVKTTQQNIPVITFQYPEEALEFIVQEDPVLEARMHTILLLDINMPNISGWQFLQKFESFKPSILNSYSIYILSSSISSSDKLQASQNKRIKRFLEKPFNINSLRAVISDFD